MDNQINYILNIFAQYEHCFTLEDLSNFAEPDYDREILKKALLNDTRFLLINKETSKRKYFLPKRRLFQWLCQLNLRLAQAKQIRLNKHQLTNLARSLFIKQQTITPLREIVQFGKRFGLIGNTWKQRHYFFPVAYILSFMPSELSEATIKSIIEEISSKTIDDKFFIQPLTQESITEEFSCLKENESYIIRAREGFLTGKKMTLQWIGDHYGTSKERIRQEEFRAWRRLRYHENASIFSRALIYQIMRKQGSLIVEEDSHESLTTGFLTKCSRVPYMTVSHISSTIIGNIPDDILVIKPRETLLDYIDSDTIITRWEAQAQLFLIKKDLQFLADHIVRLSHIHLYKAQRIYLALRSIGKPAHSTKITKVYNSLYPDHKSTEYNIHAILNQEKFGIVWTGINGTFALSEWGYERPSDTLTNTIKKIVERKYKETAQGVHLKEVVAEMKKYRQIVNESSVHFILSFNPDICYLGKNYFGLKKPDEDKKKFSKRS